MRKISLKQSEWLWALNRGKLKEYYEKHYGLGTIDYNDSICGQIVSQLFLNCDRLLGIAYRNLHFDWTINLHSSGLLNDGDFIGKATLNKSMFTFLLFNALKYSITREDLNEIVDGDWDKYWQDLDKEFYVYDFESWCKNESWNCEDIIDDIDNHAGWGEVWEYIEPYLSDEMIDFMRLHDEDEEDEEGE